MNEVRSQKSEVRMWTLWLLGTLLIAPSLAPAQEGHPLVGTWHGTWGVNDKNRNDITLVMTWDGKQIGGMINPGLSAGKLQNASLNPDGWQVHFEADMKDASGAMVHVTADGKLTNITNVRRGLSGAWSQGSQKGDFQLKRDN